MKNSLLVVLRVLVAVLLAGSLLVQVVIIPWMAWAVASDAPEVAYLAAPYVAAAFLAIACAQVVLVSTWRLTLLVGSDAIFDASSLRWVNLMVKASAVATALTAAVAIQVGFVKGAGPVTVFLGLYGCALGAAAFWMILLVLRGLLRAAVANKAELDEVV